MKIHKNNVKLYFKDKNTIIALCLLFVFLCAFLISFAPFATSVKGISEMFSTSKIQDLYSNNYSTIYVVDEDNVLHYSFDKRIPGHLNEYAEITSLDNEYGDATTHYYNFITIDYDFGNIVKVDGFRDNAFGLDGYTLVLTEINDLYMLYNNTTTFVKILSDVIDVDAGYTNFTVLTKDHKVYEFIQKGAYLYRFDPQVDHVEKIATQGHLRVDDIESTNDRQYTSYYVTQQNEIIQNQMTIDYDRLHLYAQQDVNEIIKDIQEEGIIQTQTLLTDIDVQTICSIENATFVFTNQQQLYAIGNNYIDEDYGIFGVGEGVDSYSTFTLIPHGLNNIEKIYTTGPFALVIQTTSDFYYSGNIGYENSSTFKRITEFGDIDQIIGGYYSTIVLKDEIVYYIDYEDNNHLVRMYDNFIVQYVIKYLSLFLMVMTLFYLVVYFFEQNGKYNRYFKRRYQDESNE